MNRISIAFLASLALAWSGAARADDHGHGDDRCQPCPGVMLTALSPGDAHCPFGGVQVTVPSCPDGGGEGDHKTKAGDRGKGDDKRGDDSGGGDDKHHEDDTPPPQVAFVCNGSPGVQGPPGPPGTGGSSSNDAFTATSFSTVSLPTSTPTTIVTVAVPPGNYVVEAKAQLSHVGEGGATEIDCTVFADAAGGIDSQRVTVQGFTTTALSGPFSSTTGDTLELQCSTPDFLTGLVDSAQLVAVQVDNLNSDAPAATARTLP